MKHVAECLVVVKQHIAHCWCLVKSYIAKYWCCCNCTLANCWCQVRSCVLVPGGGTAGAGRGGRGREEAALDGIEVYVLEVRACDV